MSALLEVRNLETWYGPIAAMQGVNLEVRKGQMVTVLGANGAGKTTLLNTLAGVIDPFKGQIRFDGAEVNGLDADDVCRRGLILVPEGRQIYPFLSVRENLNMGAYTRKDSEGVRNDIERVFQWFPRLLERENQHAGLLSGGEQQMLALGRALIGSPRLLLVDELSLGLAPLIVKAIYEQLRVVGDTLGTSMLIVEQNAKLALQFASSAYILSGGRIVLSGSASDVASSSVMKESYLGGQRSTDAATEAKN